MAIKNSTVPVFDYF